MKFVLVLLLSLSGVVSYGQGLLKDWIGHYEGQMILGFLNRPADTINVELDIAVIIEDSVWTHKMTYHSSKYGEIVKDYLIRKSPSSNGNAYVLDEQNGITMPLSLMNDCFYGTYHVGDMQYINTLRRSEDELLFDLFAASDTSLKTDTIDDEGSQFVVDSYSVLLHQTAFLKRK